MHRCHYTGLRRDITKPVEGNDDRIGADREYNVLYRLYDPQINLVSGKRNLYDTINGYRNVVVVQNWIATDAPTHLPRWGV